MKTDSDTSFEANHKWCNDAQAHTHTLTHIYMYVSIYVCINLSINISICLSIYMYVYPSVYRSLSAYTHTQVYNPQPCHHWSRPVLLLKPWFHKRNDHNLGVSADSEVHLQRYPKVDLDINQRHYPAKLHITSIYNFSYAVMWKGPVEGTKKSKKS